MKRSAGILMPIFCLASKYGIGSFSKKAYEFVDFLEKAEQTYWQILPLGPTGFGDSPYQSFSTFAGNPYFIDLEELILSGLLTMSECDEVNFGEDPERVDYEKIYNNRMHLLRRAYERSDVLSSVEYCQFEEENKDWLSDYALYMAVKGNFGGKPWIEWDKDIRTREENAVHRYSCVLGDEIKFYKFVQYLFYSQWSKLKSYANSKGIKIIGDIPIYVALDSADAWSNPELFQFDKDNMPTSVAGCPPDGFCQEGQLWGNPLYRWEEHKRTNYSWWKKRIASCFKMYDVLRIDHFRGFDEYYSVPFGDKNAVNGHWEKGPGKDLFSSVLGDLSEKAVIAEDLGFITQSVRDLVADCGFYGTKVLMFAFDVWDKRGENVYLPHNYPKECTVYTGTHDNPSVMSWFNSLTWDEKKHIRNYLGDDFTPDDKLNMSFIRLIMRSCANVCIVPIQDYLGLGEKSRINNPSTVGDNWCWRIKDDMLNEDLIEKIRQITELYGRKR